MDYESQNYNLFQTQYDVLYLTFVLSV